MGRFWKEVLLAVFMGWIIPGLTINAMALFFGNRGLQSALEPETAPTAAMDPDLIIKVRSPSGWVMEMEETVYLTGVVLAEMPAYFEEEALKAQAVVARTYAMKAMDTGGKHGNGSVCMEPGCCQAYISEKAYTASVGTGEHVDKVRKAVSDTKGLVLTYEGALIEATYFSCSGGTTEDAAAVWGTEYPYLQSVDSPGEEDAAYYRDVVTMSRGELSKALGLLEDAVKTSGIGQTEFTEGGGIASIEIGGETFLGTEVRKKLGLRSTAFQIILEEDRAVITTRGYGHRVGMSQYGADAMAIEGSSFSDILAHYYTGAILQTFDRNMLHNE